MDSLASSFAQVQLNPSPGGSISQLPNELVHTFLVKLEMHELIRLRLVCPRWKAIIESIAQKKESLILSDGSYFDYEFDDDRNHSFRVTERFFGQIELKRDFVLIKLKSIKFPPRNARYLGPILVALFSNVQQLVIQTNSLYDFYSVLTLLPGHQITTLSLSCSFNHYVKQRVTPFASWINSLTALKRLDLKGDFELLLDYISPKIFTNLEHFSHDSGHEGFYITNMTKSALGYLGANCTRLSLSGYGRHSTNVPDWLNVDSILTHLSLPFLSYNYALWEGLCGKLTSLQTLYIREAYFGGVNVLSSRLVNILSRLPNLTELQLFRFCIKELLQSPERKYTALVNVRVFHLDRRFQKATLPEREQLAQFLAANLLPNVQQLTIEEH